MTPYNAIIIDDEAKLRKVLQIKLEQFCPDVRIAAMAENIDEAYAQILEHNAQLIFLDISMPGGSGFDLLDRFEKIEFEIIFVTGFNDYVLNALKVSAVDYLLKPVITDELIAAVNKAKERIADRKKIEMYHNLKHNLHHIGEQDTKIAIPGAAHYDFIKIGHIIRCEGWQKYTRIYLKDGSCLVSSYNLGVFKDMLETYGFYSTHKSHLINTQKIVRYLKEGWVLMSDDTEVPVARRKKEDFVEKVLKDCLLNKSG